MLNLGGSNVTQSESQERCVAVEAAELAVRTYAHEPSAANAVEVELAWRRLRRLDSVARWRQGNARLYVDASVVTHLKNG